ncbi:MAG: PKD domain-containing protein, partial [Chitinophagaceae bacterium]|nr:PKD domain-containing protein [Chitinophagaceae bacterium]
MKTKLVSKLKYIQLLTALSLTLGSVHAQLHADFTASPSAGCSPLIVSFRDSSTGNPTQWKWDLGNGTISFVQNPSVSYINAGTYTIKLIIKNNGGSDSISKSQFITVYENPIVNFSATPTTGCYPLHTQFTDLSIAAAGSISKWQWDFGDGVVSTQQNPNHVYTSQAQFDVKLKITNSNGCFSVIDKPSFIKINGGVKANFSYTASGNCQPPTPVNFNNSSTGTGALTYEWSFGDGGISTAKNPVHNYYNPGSYTLKLITTNVLGCTDTLVKVNGINIGAVQANFTAATSACVGSQVAITNTSAPATASSMWYFSDSSISTQINPIKTFNTPGIFQIKLVNNFGSCKDSATKNITITQKPTAAFTAVNNIACAAPVSVQFSSNSLGGATYFWNFGDGNISTLQSPTHSYNQQGNYTVSLTVANANGCKDSIAKTDFVAVAPPRIENITIDPKEGCKPLSVDFLSLVTSVQTIAQYFWEFGDGNTSTSQKPTHLYTSEGVFNVKLTVTTTGGCSDTYTRLNAVKVGHKPVPDFSATPLDGCASSGVNFYDLSTNGPATNWFWQFGDGKTSMEQNPWTDYMDTGYFTIKLIVW